MTVATAMLAPLLLLQLELHGGTWNEFSKLLVDSCSRERSACAWARHAWPASLPSSLLRKIGIHDFEHSFEHLNHIDGRRKTNKNK